MQVLYVEDNKQIAENVREYLELEWWNIVWMADGLLWWEAFQQKTFDIVVLDVMMPGLDGFSLLRKIRERSECPVIMTTAKGELNDKEEWFDDGADDYLVKPFAMKELVMRMRSLFKRSSLSDVFRFGDVEVFLDDNVVKKWWETLKISLKEFQILSCLIDAWWHAVSRWTIVDFVWWGDALWESDGKLDVYISTLRKKLWKELIVTIKGFGYKLWLLSRSP